MEDDPLITLKVLDLEGRRVYHTMRMNNRLQGLMDAYYKKVADVTYGSGTFMFDGSIRLRGTNTPAELDLNDEDEIEFFPTMIGGGSVGA
ncbi:unnamed protein product [Miscanthus lutarioriparius]|uniref:Rad60/SUMO-like domain-containing protein n=1 Tax=Miscanthus lutarioriparius TaxID=422564 RepID=A0A811N2X2_9POAL|nr:unnamed protein product [Miscanthus lutarioriparius]